MIAPEEYWPRNPRGSFRAKDRVSGSSMETYGLSRKKPFARVVLPDCRGPVIDMIGYPVINLPSTNSASLVIIIC